jgi:hypothetical protein
MNEPRQWTIFYTNFYDGHDHITEDIDGPFTIEPVKVVELSAFDALAAENARLASELLLRTAEEEQASEMLKDARNENERLRTAQLSYLCPNHMATKLQPDGTCLACGVANEIADHRVQKYQSVRQTLLALEVPPEESPSCEVPPFPFDKHEVLKASEESGWVWNYRHVFESGAKWAWAKAFEAKAGK